MSKEYSHVAAQVLLANKLKMEKNKKVVEARKTNEDVHNSELKDVKGI